MYDMADRHGMAGQYENVDLGSNLDFLKKMSKVLTDRLAWLQDNKAFASAEKTKKLKAIDEFMIKELKDGLNRCVLSLVDKEPSTWARKDDVQWAEAVRRIYKAMDKDGLLMTALKKAELKPAITAMNVGELKEYVARNLLSPRHLNKVVELVFGEHGVVNEKRKLIMAKDGPRRKKAKVVVVDDEAGYSKDSQSFD